MPSSEPMPAPTTIVTAPRHVFIAGAGVAGLECLLGLRDLLGARVDLTLLSDSEDFIYRPRAMGEPFGLSRATHYPLAAVARDCGATLLGGHLQDVDTTRHTVELRGGERYVYDALVVALGAVPALGLGRATLLTPDPRMILELLEEITAGTTRRVAVVVPPGPHWILPAYELALLLAQHAISAATDELELTLITRERAPLEILGPEASTLMADQLSAAGVALITGSEATLTHGAPTRVSVAPSDRSFDVDRVIETPELRAPHMPGLPVGVGGFLSVDAHGRVSGVSDVYAAGDCTAFPVKQGGLAAQQAEAVVAHLASRFGVGKPAPFRPVLRGRLLTGGPAIWARRDLTTSADEATVADHALWWPPDKIAGRWLSPYLAARDDTAAGVAHAAAHGRPIKIPIDTPKMPISRDLDLLGDPS